MIFCQSVCNVTIVSSLHGEDVYFLIPPSCFTPFLLNLFKISAISAVPVMSSGVYFSPRKILSVKQISQVTNRHFNILSFPKSLYN